VDVDAGTHIKSVTTLHEMHGSERIVFKSKGGTIIIDGGGITLKGNVTIKGNVAISGGSGGGAKAANLRINKGSEICIPCLIKKQLGGK
jgi:type VI secretion system secreted protein VgrG